MCKVRHPSMLTQHGLYIQQNETRSDCTYHAREFAIISLILQLAFCLSNTLIGLGQLTGHVPHVELEIITARSICNSFLFLSYVCFLPRLYSMFCVVHGSDNGQPNYKQGLIAKQETTYLVNKMVMQHRQQHPCVSKSIPPHTFPV